MRNYFLDQQRTLALMLLPLHGLMLGGFSGGLASTFLVCHYGLFLLWQPLWRGEQKLTWVTASLFLIGGALLWATINWWILSLWSAALFGLLGGRVFSTSERLPRTSYLMAAVYLLAMMMIWVVPQLLGHTEQDGASYLIAAYLLPAIPVVLLFFPDRHRDYQDTPPLDFFYSLVLFLLAVILVLGSFAIEVNSHTLYLVTLIRLLLIVASVLLVMSWLWNPRAGFGGIGQLLSRYLLSVGMPFEHWLERIALLAASPITPQAFIEGAAHELASLPWVSGGGWHTSDSRGTFGMPATYMARFSAHDLELTLHTRQLLTPTLMLHIHLMTRLLGEFYQAKKREASLRDQSYMRAVHETGARLTHDIKNLLQSLGTLCAAVENHPAGDQRPLVELVRRQLPMLNHRLEMTLNKLQSPQTEMQETMPIALWWHRAQARHSDPRIHFAINGVLISTEIDSELFDPVLDNLIQNALNKSQQTANLNIEVVLTMKTAYPELAVTDHGEAIPEPIASRLFQQRIASSGQGLGIGLYQAAQQAKRAGYVLTLAHNQQGQVTFLLRRQA